MGRKLLLIIIFLLPVQITFSQSNFVQSSKIGIGVNYGGQANILPCEFSFSNNLNNRISLNFRSATSFNKLFRIGGGIEIYPFAKRKINYSFGIEIYHQIERLDGIENFQSFRNLQIIPISFKYLLKQKGVLEVALVLYNTPYSNESDSFGRIVYYHNLGEN